MDDRGSATAPDDFAPSVAGTATTTTTTAAASVRR